MAVNSDALSDPARLRALRQTGLDTGGGTDEALERFARLVRDVLDVPVALVSLVAHDRQFFPGAAGLPAPSDRLRQRPLSHSPCRHVVERGQPVVLSDIRLDTEIPDEQPVGGLGIVAYAGMPLTDLEGRTLGALAAVDGRPREWTSAELTTLADLAAACSSELRLRITLDQAEAARRRAEEAHAQLSMLADLTETLVGTLDIEDALARLAAAVVPRLADWCVVNIVGPRGTLRHVASAHHDPRRAEDVSRFSTLMRSQLDQSAITRTVLRTGQPVLDRNAELRGMRNRTLGPEMPELAARMGYASHVTVPITAPVRGTVLGTISLVKGADREAFTDADVRTALDIGRRAGLAVDNTRMYGEQRHVAEVLQQSLLTDLPTSPHLELHARYQPAASGAEVGGDWYDAFVQPDGDLIATIGDAAGHDIEAAAAMGQLRNLIRGNAYGRSDRVGELMAHLDATIRGLRIPKPATAILARVHHNGGVRQLSWTNAGHPPPMVLRADGEVEVLHRQPESLLGLTWGATRRTTHETVLEPGATLLLYTDGLVERRGSHLDDGIAELRDRLRAAAELPTGELCDALLRQADSREDDIALLAIRTTQP